MKMYRTLWFVGIALFFGIAPKSFAQKTDSSAISKQVDMIKTEVMNERTQTLVLKDLLKKESNADLQRSIDFQFQNELGKQFLVDSLVYKINGEIVYQFEMDETAKTTSRIPESSFETKVVPAQYTLEIQVVFRGSDMGVFSYINDYMVTRDAKTTIDLTKKSDQGIVVRVYESAGLLKNFKDRPQLQVQIKN